MDLLPGRCLVSALGGGLDGDCRAMWKFHENHENCFMNFKSSSAITDVI